MRSFRASLAPLLVGMSLALAGFSVVAAQETGGSFGGSDFGSGGGGGSDYGGGGGGGSDYGGSSFGSTDYGSSGSYDSSSSYGGGSGDVDAIWGLVCCLLSFFGLAYLLAFLGGVGKTVSSRANALDSLLAHASGPVGDVSAIRIALDHNARPALQARLDALARSGASGTAAGRATALHEVCIELRRNQTSWLHASVENSPLTSIPVIQARYTQAAADARSRFRIETVRSGDGALASTEDTTTRDRGEGPGIVVVTVIVAARRELADVHQPDDARQLSELLMTFGGISATELMGLEVIWSPSDEDDRMTEDEMKRVYPEMRLIRSDTIAGRVFCGYCGSPFAHELSRCPHCGAPTNDARTAGGGIPGGPAPSRAS